MQNSSSSSFAAEQCFNEQCFENKSTTITEVMDAKFVLVRTTIVITIIELISVFNRFFSAPTRIHIVLRVRSRIALNRTRERIQKLVDPLTNQ